MILATAHNMQRVREGVYEIASKHKLFYNDATVGEVIQWAREATEHSDLSVTIGHIDTPEASS